MSMHPDQKSSSRKPLPKVLGRKHSIESKDDDKSQTSNLTKHKDACPTSSCSSEVQHAEDIMMRLKRLEDLQSNTSLLLEQRLCDFAEVQRRLSALEELEMRHQNDLAGRSGRAGSIMPDRVQVRAASDTRDSTVDRLACDDAARKTLVHELANTQKYQLDGSVWEAAAVIGLPGLRIFDSVSIVMGLTCNVFVQMLFCVIANLSFTDEGMSTVEDVRRWRYTVAHDVAWSDTSGVSLTSRVCGGDASLIVSTAQLDLVEHIRQYLSILDTYFFSTSQGALLCSVAIVIWLLLVIAEWRKSVTFVAATWFDSTYTTRDVDGLQTTVGWRRFVAMLVIVGIRLGVSLALLRSGVEWLLNTTSLNDIILNAAGLGFVMDVDEIVFETLLTMPVKTLLHSIEFHASLRWRGRWCAGRVVGVWFPCFAWLSVAALMAYVLPELLGNVNTMEELDKYLCGGNSDFVSTTTSTGIIIVKKSEGYNGDLASTYETKSLEEAVLIPDLTDVSLSWLALSDSWFSLIHSVTTAETASSSVYCADKSDWGVYTTFLKEDLGLDSFDCRDVSHFCAASNSSTIRLVCPVTCGCAHPQSSLYLNGALYACPLVCKEHEQYKVALENISCSTSDVLDHPNWTDFVWNMAVHNEELGDIQEQMRDDLLAYGCEAVQWYQASLCQNTLINSGFALWCPVECGCRVPNGFYDTTCPPSCEQWRSKYEESLAHLPCEDASALEFTSGPSRTFLELHIATFQHVSGIYDSEDLVWLQLTTYGCGGLPQEWCGFARRLRAVCPVICGCLEDFSQPGCRLSCFAEVSSTNVSLTHDGSDSDS